MKPVDQTAFGEGKGNCLSAALASILELPLRAVPFFHGHLRQQVREMNAWLAPYGLRAVHRTLHPGARRPQEFYILLGRSPRSNHAVVAHGRHVVHDPNPSRDGLLRVHGTITLAPRNLRRGAASRGSRRSRPRR